MTEESEIKTSEEFLPAEMADVGLSLEKIDELRPTLHHHVALLTAGGVAPAKALAIAAQSAALVYSPLCADAVRRAFEALAPTP